MKVLLVVLAILVQSQQGIAYPGLACGGVTCLERDGVQCFAENNYCRCPKYQVGNARFECVDPDTSCVCYLYGDPYVTAFSSSVMPMVLPCRHVLTEFITPDNIYVKISADASPGSDRAYPGYVFEDRLYVLATKGKTKGTAEIRRSGFYKKDLLVPTPASANFPEFGLACYGDDSHHFVFEILNRGVKLRYRSEDSSVTIEAPKDSQFFGNRLCGDCNDNMFTYRNSARMSNASLPEWSLLKTIRNLDYDEEADETCRAVSRNFRECSPNKQAEAVRYCGVPYTNNQVGACIANAIGKQAVLRMMARCIREYCNDNRGIVCSAIVMARQACPSVDFSMFDCPTPL